MEVVQAIEEFAWIGWVVLILLFLTIEALTLEFTFLMLALGGIAGLVADLLGAELWLQVVIGALTAAVLILFLRPPLLRRLRRGADPAKSNVAALIGMRGLVTLTVTGVNGQVKLSNGDIWTARTQDGADIDPGTVIAVAAIDGATAFVAPAGHKTKEAETP